MKRRSVRAAAAVLGAVAIVLIGVYAGYNLSAETVCDWATRGHGC